MVSHIPRILAFLALLATVSHAVLSPELYWKSALPTTPMPKAISDLLYPEFGDEKSTSVGVGKGGVNVNTGKGKSGGNTHVSVGKGPGVNVNTGKPGGGGTHVSVGKGQGVQVGAGKPGKRTSVGVGKGGVSVSTGHKGKPVYVGVHPGPNPFNYLYSASADQLHDSSTVALFFLEKDVRPGTKMNLNFVKTSAGASFLPRKAAEAIPFSSEKFPEILKRLSVAPGSAEAEAMKATVEECESPSVKGEEKYCATSLEAMVDWTASKLGRNAEAISTEVEGETGAQTYTVTGVVKKKASGEKSVACHRQSYAYAVFLCHATKSTKTYVLSLVGADGTKAKAVAVCHTDTSAWNPKHIAFQVLKVSPGTVPVCHFLPEDHIVWIPSKKSV